MPLTPTITRPATRAVPPSHAERDAGVLGALVDLSRARQALLSVAQPALGAVLAAGGLPDRRTMVLGLIAATTGFLAVFSLNDVFDRRVDARALAAGKAEFEGHDLDTAFMRHPLARGGLSLRQAALWVALLGACSAIASALLNPVCLLLLAIAVALEGVYCALRSVTWAKTFISGVMVAVGGLAGWVAVRPPDAGAMAFLVFLVVWEIAGRNLPNDLADVGADSRTSLTTVATVFGGGVSARAVAAGSTLAVLALGLLPMPKAASVAAVAVGVWIMAVPATRLVANPVSAEAGRYFNRASLLPALVLPIAIAALEVLR